MLEDDDLIGLYYLYHPSGKLTTSLDIVNNLLVANFVDATLDDEKHNILMR